MPHLHFQTPINGFYDDALKNDVRNRVILYAKVSSNAGADFQNQDTWKRADENWTNNFRPIGITTLTENLAISTQYQWSKGGNLMDSFKIGFKEGMQSVKEALTGLVNSYDQIIDGAGFSNSRASIDDAILNMITRKHTRKIINSMEAFAKYGGSKTEVSIPPLEFVFVAKDFELSHITDAFKLLSFLLPINGTDSEKTSAEGKAGKGNIPTAWLYEEAPNNYVNPFRGFDTSMVEGTFALDVGGNIIKELVPNSVSLVVSKTKVLSDYDYEKIAPNLKEVLGEKYQRSVKCQKSKVVPLIVRIRVDFMIAKKIMAADYITSFFTYDDYSVKGKVKKDYNPNIDKLLATAELSKGSSVDNSGLSNLI